MWWTGVKVEELPRVGPRVETLLEQIVARSDMDMSWIKQQLFAGNMQLWLYGNNNDIELVCLTKLEIRPKGKVAVIWGCAGKNLDTHGVLLDTTLVAWARQLGAVAIESTGRIGWERWLSQKGWRRATVTMRKEL